MVRQYINYTKPLPLRVAIGTYNINGGKHFRSIVYKDVSLSDWLLDAHKSEKTSGKEQILKLLLFIDVTCFVHTRFAHQYTKIYKNSVCHKIHENLRNFEIFGPHIVQKYIKYYYVKFNTSMLMFMLTQKH